MRVSHSWTPQLTILEILTHFWPESEPCRQATINDMDFIFPVLTLPSPTCPPCKYKGMDILSWSTVICHIWGQFRWNLVIYGSKVLFWRGSIKRPDLQTVYRYRAKSFRVDCNMIGRSAVTRSDLMRVSHSWTPQLTILEILTHFWPESEPCRQATIKDMDVIFPVRTLPTIIYRPWKYKGMYMPSWSTVVCQIWGQFRLNLVLYGSKDLFWRGSIKRPDLPTAYRYRAKSFRVDSNMIGRSAVTRSDIMPVSHSWKPKLTILEILTHFWPASEPCRQATIKDMDFIFPVRTLPTIIYRPWKYKGMDMRSWSKVVCHIWGQFRLNLVLHGSKCHILKRVHQTARSPKRRMDTGLNPSGSIPIW